MLHPICIYVLYDQICLLDRVCILCVDFAALDLNFSNRFTTGLSNGFFLGLRLVKGRDFSTSLVIMFSSLSFSSSLLFVVVVVTFVLLDLRLEGGSLGDLVLLGLVFSGLVPPASTLSSLGTTLSAGAFLFECVGFVTFYEIIFIKFPFF